MIHVTFSSSAAGTLRQVLRSKGLRQRVVDLTDNLSWGPIAIDGFENRQAWLDINAPFDLGPWGWIAESAVKFLESAAADTDRLIWIAPRSANEQAGFYWYLDHFDAHETQMVIADYPVCDAWRDEPPFSLGELNEDRMAGLFDESPRVAWDSSRFPRDRWQTLVADNALLRIVQNGKLQSAPEDFFDHFLLAQCSQEWTKPHRVVGHTMGSLWDAGHSPGSDFLSWRLRELIQLGKVLCDGPPPKLFEVSTNAARIRLP